MSERESELRFLARNVEAVETVAMSAIMSQIVSLFAREGKHQVIDILELNKLISGYNKIDDAIVELKNLIHQMNGTQAEPNPHGSRDTFSPQNDPGEEFWARMRERDEEQYNAMQD